MSDLEWVSCAGVDGLLCDLPKGHAGALCRQRGESPWLLRGADQEAISVAAMWGWGGTQQAEPCTSYTAKIWPCPEDAAAYQLCYWLLLQSPSYLPLFAQIILSIN